MKVEVSTLSPYQRKLTFTVPADEVRQELDAAFRQVGRNARIRGFRPGKVPRRVLEGRFGAAIRADVGEKLVQTYWSRALSEEVLRPVSQPRVDDMGELRTGADFQFSLLVDVKPEIELERYTGVEVVFPKTEVTDDEVDQMVRAQLEANARLVEVTDRGVQKGDMVMVELVARDGEDEVAREIGTMIRTESDPYYPGLEDALVGMKTGESKQVRVQFGDEARIEEVAGRELDVEVKIISIQANEVPELTDEIAAELGYEGGAEGMRQALSARLAETREGLARNQARANLLERIIEVNPFEIPDGMVDQALQMLVRELALQEAYRTGIDPREVRFSQEQVADLRQRAVFAAKANLVLEYVQNAEGIEVTDDDFEAWIRRLAEEQGQAVEAVRGRIAAQEAEDDVRDRILEEKTLDWLLERARLVEPSEQAAPEAADAPAEAADAPAEAADPPAEAAPVDLSVLDQRVADVKAALATGSFDDALDALEAAEKAGKNRKGALAAIASRRG